MLAEIRATLRPAFVLLVLLTALTGIAYPLAIAGIAQTLFPAQANGSLIVVGGTVVGSELIGQNFTGEVYFHPRPSAAGGGYDASASAASNLAPGSKDLADLIDASVKEFRAQGATEKLPADIVTTSASGLDLHISPESALIQVNRVAKARGLQPDAVKTIVVKQVEKPLLGFLGEPRVNVLLLNRQIDRESAKHAL